jgi:alpha-ketoglutarate-dependent taurine dioxygenase
MSEMRQRSDWPPLLPMPVSLTQSLTQLSTVFEQRFILVGLEDGLMQREVLALALTQAPGLQAFLASAIEQIAAAGVVIVTGGYVGSDLILVTLCAALGQVSASGNGYPPRLVHDVRARDPAGRMFRSGSLGSAPFALHTDSACRVRPHEYFALACVRAPAHAGGESLLLLADDVAAELVARGEARALALLAEPVYPFVDYQLGAAEVIRSSILTIGADHYRVRYNAACLADGLGRQPLRPSDVRALQCFEEVIHDDRLVRELLLGPGDLLLADNSRLLHGRRGFSPTAGRLLKRCKIYSIFGERAAGSLAQPRGSLRDE